MHLIDRGGRSLALTETGKLLLARTVGPMREIEDAVIAAREGLSAPRGRLRVAAPLLFSQLALGLLAARFRALYPGDAYLAPPPEAECQRVRGIHEQSVP